MAALKPAYLIWGDDEAKIDAWRTRVRSRAQAEGGSAALEVLSGERLTPQAVADAACTLSLAVGHRYVLADGIEGWKERDVEPVEVALAALPADTVVVMIVRGKAPGRLAKAVGRCGGEVHACAAPRPAAYPDWIAERARELGIALTRDGAHALIDRVGCNQRRLLRELEKLAAFAREGERVGSDVVEALTASAAEARVYELADAVIERDAERTMRLAEDLRVHGEDVLSLLFPLVRQLRSCHRAWAMLESGKPTSEVQSALRLPPYVARRVVAQARQADGEQIELALNLLADLDYAARGVGALDPDTALSLTLVRATTGRFAPAGA